MSEPSQEEVAELLELLRDSDFVEFRLRAGDFSIDVSRATGGLPLEPGAGDRGLAKEPVSPSEPASPRASVSGEAGASESMPSSSSAGLDADEGYFVRAPMAGVVYLRPEPSAEPFVEVGSAVSADSPVALLEVMKLFQTLLAGCDGVVVEFLVKNEELVEPGQALVRVEPNASAPG